MFAIPVNHYITYHPKCQQGPLNLLCTCYLQILSYHLKMAELSVNICKLYKIYIITGHIIQKLCDHWPHDIKDILVICVFW